jgi:hypothetical protein
MTPAPDISSVLQQWSTSAHARRDQEMGEIEGIRRMLGLFALEVTDSEALGGGRWNLTIGPARPDAMAPQSCTQAAGAEPQTVATEPAAVVSPVALPAAPAVDKGGIEIAELDGLDALEVELELGPSPQPDAAVQPEVAPEPAEAAELTVSGQADDVLALLSIDEEDVSPDAAEIADARVEEDAFDLLLQVDSGGGWQLPQTDTVPDEETEFVLPEVEGDAELLYGHLLDAGMDQAEQAEGPMNLAGVLALASSDLLVAPPERRTNPFSQSSVDAPARARRLARTLVSDMIEYDKALHAASLVKGPAVVRKTFASQIDLGRKEFAAQVSAESVPDREAIFVAAVNEILGNNQAVL